MTTTSAALLTLGVLALAGLLPVLALVGPRLVVVPLLPLAGAVICAVAAVSSVAVVGSLLMWFIVWSSVATGVSVVVVLGRLGLARRMLRDLRRGARPLVMVGGLVVVATVAWTLRGLRVPDVGFDTRAIWIIHAHWLAQGHAFALAALRNPFLVVTHPGYPPLTSSVMALAWRISGTGTDRLAVVMVALLNACALTVAGWGIVEAARLGARKLHTERRRQRGVIALGIVVAGLTVLVAGGVEGAYGTNGYADPLWSLSAVAMVVYGLVLSPSASDLAVVAVVAGVAGLTKVEGTAVAIFVLVVIGARVARRPGQIGAPGWVRRRRTLLALGGGIAALLVWPVLTIVLNVPTDPNLAGNGQGSLGKRTDSTFDAMIPHLHVVVLAALFSGVSWLILRRQRNRLGLGNDLWTWAALVGATIILGGAYVVGPGNVELWLATSVDRTTIFVALLAWWIVALWALSGMTGVLE